jgi:hypothetical protein
LHFADGSATVGRAVSRISEGSPSANKRGLLANARWSLALAWDTNAKLRGLVAVLYL